MVLFLSYLVKNSIYRVSVIFRLTENWRKSVDSKETVAIVSMDLSKAFDSIPHALLLAKLKAYGLGETSIELLMSYLSERIQRVKIGDTFLNLETCKRRISPGKCPWSHIKQANLNAYVDDEKFYSSDKYLETLNTRLEHELGIANNWYERNDMIVNPDKLQTIVLGPNSNCEFSVTRI